MKAFIFKEFQAVMVSAQPAIYIPYIEPLNIFFLIINKVCI